MSPIAGELTMPGYGSNPGAGLAEIVRSTDTGNAGTRVPSLNHAYTFP